jgi:biopolymer transport protein TolR
LKADKEVPYGIVAKVMAEIKAAGVEKLGMVTIPIEEDPRRAGGR